jgi:glycosyltransferase involved in cell wall biosynthesis
MRILLVHSGADLYGASRSFLRLSCRLARDGHQLLTVLPYDGPLVNELRGAGIEVVIEPRLTILTRERFGLKISSIELLLTLPYSVLRLCSIIREFRPELVHTNTAVAISPAIAARCTGTPHIWHIREFFGDFKQLWRLYQKLIVKFSDRIVCVSGAVAEQFEAAYRSKTVVLHNGFPRQEFEPVAQERTAAFRQRFGLDGCQVIGLVGRIKFGRKGQDVFLKAAAKIKDRFPNARFLCIGSPFPGNESHLVKLNQLAVDLGLCGQFIYTGDVEDIKAAYSALDISVLASAQPEPFGGIVIESMAMGLPVIGTALGGTVEQIKHGATGLLVPPGDSESLAEAMSCLLSSPGMRAKLGVAARNRFLDDFEFEPFYHKVISLYQSVVRYKTAHA